MRLAAVRTAALWIIVPAAVALCACLVLAAGSTHASRPAGPSAAHAAMIAGGSGTGGPAPTGSPTPAPSTPTAQPNNDPWD